MRSRAFRTVHASGRNVFVRAHLSAVVARSLRVLGIVGAVLLLVGPVLIGAGFANSAYAEQQEINCTGTCRSQDSNVLNATIATELFFGIGLAIIGVGAGLVFACATQFMSRWPSKATIQTASTEPSLGGVSSGGRIR